MCRASKDTAIFWGSVRVIMAFSVEQGSLVWIGCTFQHI